LLLMLFIQMIFSIDNNTCKEINTCITDFSIKCSGTYNINCDPSKADTQCCPQYSYCVDNKCILQNYGGQCDKKADCFYDQIGTGLYDCVQNKCVALFNQGDKCNTKSDCFGFMDCTSGYCQGSSVGMNCLMPEKGRDGYIGFDCAHGLFCQDNVCRTSVVENGNCSSSLECVMGTLCSPTTRTCVAMYSLPVNSTCTGAEGLCDHTTVCVSGTCVAAIIYPKPLVCYDDKDCSGGHCSPCNPFTGTKQCILDSKKPALNCRAEEIARMDCFIKNNCSNTPAYQVGTCQHDNCLIEMQASWYCEMCLDEDSLGTCYGRFDINGHCIIPLPLWLTAAIVGGFTVVLLLLLLAMCKIGDACTGDEQPVYAKIN